MYKAIPGYFRFLLLSCRTPACSGQLFRQLTSIFWGCTSNNCHSLMTIIPELRMLLPGTDMVSTAAFVRSNGSDGLATSYFMFRRGWMPIVLRIHHEIAKVNPSSECAFMNYTSGLLNDFFHRGRAYPGLGMPHCADAERRSCKRCQSVYHTSARQLPSYFAASS